MFSFFQKNPRALVLLIGLILVSGSVAYKVLPRMEDPRLTPRAARILTVLPGADAERVESLVTEKLETEIREIEEVKTLRSFSSTNVSYIGIELNDDVNETEAENTWTRIRDKTEDARAEMPAATLAPDFKTYDITASALILALKWEQDAIPNYAIMHRLMKQLKDAVDGVSGTESSELFGAPDEEILVSLDPESMTAMQLRPKDISRAVSASDSKVAAGLLRSQSDNILLEVAGELDTLKRVGQIPIQIGDSANFVELADVALIEKTVKLPVESKVIIEDRTSIALAIQMEPEVRLDHWGQKIDLVLNEFEAGLPSGLSLNRVFEQSKYVDARMIELGWNMVYAMLAILLVILVFMGWRPALIVGLALPLVTLMVVACMNWFGIPIHQMSVTGLIISLGLMIDNAIVVSDEISQRLREGEHRDKVVHSTLSFLAMPLLGSTITTALSFSPIMLMGGPAGEFVGAIAIVAAISVFSSLLLSFCVIGPLSGLFLKNTSGYGWPHHGIFFPSLGKLYRFTIKSFLENPYTGVALAVALPVLGFVILPTLPEQFFPPAERNQFHIELELPSTSSIEETERYAKQIRAKLLKDDRVEELHWFLGASAPIFYYNVVPDRFNLPNYGQAIVDCRHGTDVTKLLNEIQADLEHSFPKPTILLQQLEQGPPFDAPIEIRLEGPDNKTLREIGDQIRLVLMETDHVYHTKSGFSEPAPKISFAVDEQQAKLVGLDFQEIANELNTSLEGTTGGSIIESSEELPIRVRVSGQNRQSLGSVASLDMLVPNRSLEKSVTGYRGLPLSAISRMTLKAETVSITRHNGQRINEIQAFLDAGVLPAAVLDEFKQRFADSGIELPPGYRIAYGGAQEERDDAIASLVGNLFVILTLMTCALIFSLGSFRLAFLLFGITILASGFAVVALWIAGYPWGFMSMVAMMGMIGVAVNDSIVVLASIRSLPPETARYIPAIVERVFSSTRHILSTTVTTIFGFTPLFLFGGDFWSPVAITMSGGVAGATVLALVFAPCMYAILYRCNSEQPEQIENDEEYEFDMHTSEVSAEEVLAR